MPFEQLKLTDAQRKRKQELIAIFERENTLPKGKERARARAIFMQTLFYRPLKRGGDLPTFNPKLANEFGRDIVKRLQAKIAKGANAENLLNAIYTLLE